MACLNAGWALHSFSWRVTFVMYEPGRFHVSRCARIISSSAAPIWCSRNSICFIWRCFYCCFCMLQMQRCWCCLYCIIFAAGASAGAGATPVALLWLPGFRAGAGAGMRESHVYVRCVSIRTTSVPICVKLCPCGIYPFHPSIHTLPTHHFPLLGRRRRWKRKEE